MFRFIVFLCLFASSVAYASPPVSLVTEEEAKQFRQALPTVDDAEIQAVLAADDLVFYTEKVMPKAYQFANTFHSPYYNISGEPDPFGNGNREFPWNEAGGAHNAKNLEVFRFIKFPKKENGEYWPLVYWNEKLPITSRDANGSSWRWRYPKGTVVGELMGINHGGYTYPFELRLRIREQTEWAVDVYRPFPSSIDMANRIAELQPNWKQDKDLTLLMEHLQGTWEFPEKILRDRSGKGFTATVKVHKLPPINNDELVARLLIETVWKSALGAVWQQDANDGEYVNSPTINNGDGFHIVPEGYEAHAFGVDRQECMQCHKHTNKAVSSFSPDRGWYGRIRGSDGIFSFHPIAKSTISSNGYRKPAKINAALANKQLVQRYSKSKHPTTVYSKLDSELYVEGK